jgi:hypothetical protein
MKMILSCRRSWTVVGLGSIPVLCFALAGSARADSPQAIAMDRFKQGAEAYARKDYRAAAIAFESAQAAIPAGATIYNAALAWVAASEPLRAGNDFAAALELGGLSAAQSVDAFQRLEAIDKELGHLEVVGPTGSRIAVDGAGEMPVPARVRVLAAEHYISVTRPDGTTDTRRVRVARGASARVDFAPTAAPPAPEVRQEPPPPPAPPLAPPTPQEPAAPPPPEPASASTSSIQRTLGWVGMGAGVAASGVAVALGVVGVNAKNDFVSRGEHDQGLHDQAIAMRTGANVTWVTAGVLAAGGLVLFLTSPKHPAHEEGTATTVSLGPTGLTIAGRF